MGELLEDVRWEGFDNHRRIQVVGEDHYQQELVQVSGGQVNGSLRYQCTAELRRDPENSHDPLAIAVLIDGVRIGYLKGGSAKRLNKRLKALEEDGQRTTSVALIRATDGGRLQAHLQVDYGSDLLKGWKRTSRGAG